MSEDDKIVEDMIDDMEYMLLAKSPKTVSDRIVVSYASDLNACVVHVRESGQRLINDQHIDPRSEPIMLESANGTSVACWSRFLDAQTHEEVETASVFLTGRDIHLALIHTAQCVDDHYDELGIHI